MEVLVISSCGVDVSVCRITPSTGVTIDPFQPVLSTMAGLEVLEIVRDGEALALHSSEEVLHDWVGVVAKGDLDWSLKSMNVTIITGSLVCFMLLSLTE